MRKWICLSVAIVLCMMLAVPGFASGAFAPSISYKDAPAVVEQKNEAGESVFGLITGSDGSAVDAVAADILEITSVAGAGSAGSTAAAELLEVYEAVVSGTMQLPFEKLGDVDTGRMVVRDMFDISWEAHSEAQGYRERVDEEGVTLVLSFDLGIAADVKVYAMTYNDGQWNPISGTVNNGDGTVTCTFEHLCPVAFCVEQTEEQMEAVQTGAMPQPAEQTSDTGMWAAIFAVAAVALVVLVTLTRKKKNN